MANPYRQLFAAPGTRGFALAGLLARIPLPMTGIGIITMLAQLRGSYALAGAVSATFVLTYALLSPQISRLVDRHGQRRVLPAATAISVMGMLIVLVSAWWHAADWTLFLGALLTGFMPSMSAMVRARWTAIYRGQPRLQTAYSLETVFDEATFIAGPPLAVGLSVAMFAQAGLLAAAVLLILGVFALLAQRGSEPAVLNQSTATQNSKSVIGIANVRLLALLMVAMGIIVGTVDIVSVAFAEQLDKPAAASLVLSAYAGGSCLAGLLFGTLKLQMPLHRLLLLGSLATAATTLPLLLAGSIATLAGAVLVAGLFFAPTMIVAMSLVERLVPEHQLTEGMTWLLAGLNVGVALGAAASGQVVDSWNAPAGFYVALCAAALLLLVALCAYQRLRANDKAITGGCVIDVNALQGFES
ncbi:MFS transporter [Pseudomonas sp. P66]|uniref:MFS transporter n=1 Tax=Pseudomonas arcuscaelestis TaxID=2710591 RepID=A0ABS2BU34_9PSED|nr:MFS transporter [Pseudomonas arcuscaelestis]MBM3114085.1 MFS transporter [Pseudomonas arcuscaelestis]MBM5456985.1 MFS transporter [Pseudomonas arcuscaelestis]